MSKKTEKFELDLSLSIKRSLLSPKNRLPDSLPSWMINEGIQPGARFVKAVPMGSSGSKTDVIIHFEDSNPIKISAKLSSADYFGNWYSHKRIQKEFGEEAFERLVTNCTEWANNWKHSPRASIFVGVSVCFGRRSGTTGREFTDIFDYSDIVKIVAGYGTGDHVANCLYISSDLPQSTEDLLNNLEPINEETIHRLSSNFKVIYRPINPMTEHYNRVKCIYTQFKPYRILQQKTNVTKLSELLELGEFVPVELGKLNHNSLLNSLESYYNIFIPRKPKSKGEGKAYRES